MASGSWDPDREFHESLVSSASTVDAADRAHKVHLEEIRTTPLFRADVLAAAMLFQLRIKHPDPNLLPQYGFLAKILRTFGGQDRHDRENILTAESSKIEQDDSRLFVNVNAPWSAFICGSQGSGKSHTLSCMLETALNPSRLGKLPRPLAGMIFHYDKFTGFSSSQICEAAYLSSTGIPVRVLVSPSNMSRMRKAYENLPGIPSNAKKPVVAPLLLQEKHLNVDRMMKLMAIDGTDGKTPLYMESVCRILRSIAMKNQGSSGLNYKEFKDRLSLEVFNDGQLAMLSTRLQLLESFMYQPEKATGTGPQVKPKYSDSKKGKAQAREWEDVQDARRRAEIAESNIWIFEPGSLTIVDLSCPFVDESAACAMFNICLALFLEEREVAGRIVALDEAHKFMTGTESSSTFTESLLSVIRQQRHLATRVIIATQEPTISPSLLDLSSMTIVHRFTSPSWLAAIQTHLAGVSSEGNASKRGVANIFKQIVELEAGQALVFSPSAMVGMEDGANHRSLSMQKLGTRYLQVRVRERVTADGGRSILAV